MYRYFNQTLRYYPRCQIYHLFKKIQYVKCSLKDKQLFICLLININIGSSIKYKEELKIICKIICAGYVVSNYQYTFLTIIPPFIEDWVQIIALFSSVHIRIFFLLYAQLRFINSGNKRIFKRFTLQQTRCETSGDDF